MIALPRKTKLMLASCSSRGPPVGYFIAHELATINNHPAPTPNKATTGVNHRKPFQTKRNYVPEPSKRNTRAHHRKRCGQKHTQKHSLPTGGRNHTVKNTTSATLSRRTIMDLGTRRLWEQGRTPSLKKRRNIGAPSSTSAPSPKHSPHHLGRERPASDRRFGRSPVLSSK